MYQLLELESLLDRDHLKVAVPDVEQVQFDKPLTNDDYKMLAQVLEQHPNVALRAYGFSKELATWSSSVCFLISDGSASAI